MDCIELEGNIQELSLLTHRDKLSKLEQLLSKKRHKSDIFLPSDSFYGEVVSAEDPERMAGELFKWLGIKHRSLSFHLDPSQDQLIKYSYRKNTSRVDLGWHCLEDPLICAAAIAHAIMHHLLLARAKISLGENEENEALTDLATIYAGFGVVVLNSFERMKILGSMAEANYAAEFLDFCSEQRVVDGIWQPYVLPGVASEFLSKNTVSDSLRPFIKSRIKHTETHKKKIVFAAGVIIAMVGSVAFLNSTRTVYPSTEMQEKRDEINVLHAQIEQCKETVERKQQTWDQSDIFIQRQIDADKTRCTSLTNRYNYEVNQYNNQL